MKSPWVITGTGLVTGAGDRPGDVFDRVGAGPPPAVDEGAAYPARRIAGFDARRYVRRKGLKLLSRTSQLACAAAASVEQALRDVPSERVGLVLGTAWGSLDSIVRFEREAHLEGSRFVDPILFTETVANVAAGHVAILYGWSGPNVTVAAGTSAGLQAIEHALEFLEEGRADVVVAGGGDELNEHLLRTLHAEGVFDGVGSEGACLLSIEHADHARARRVAPLAALAGATSGFSADREGALKPHASWLRRLLDISGWSAGSVDLLVSAEDGGARRRRAERALVAEVFGAEVPAIVTPKTVMGESWGAAGAIGVALAVEATRRPGLTREPARRAIVLDCSPSGRLAAVAVSAVD